MPIHTHPPIQTPILNRLSQVLLADVFRSIKIGNGACDLENTRVAAGGEAEAFGDEFEEAMAGFVRLAMLADETRRHLGVAVDSAGVETLFLNRASGFYSQGNDFRSFGVSTIDKIAIFDGWDFDLDVDTVE